MRPLLFSFRLALNLVFGYLLLVLILTGCQRKFIYYPGAAPEAALLALGQNHGFEPLRAGGGIIGWIRSAEPGVASPEGIILVFHGNAGFALHRTYYADAFQALSGGPWDTFILEYPGYGARAGKPSEKSLLEAAREAFLLLQETHPGPFYLLGESLGSGVATGLARQFPGEIAGMILVTPFDTLSRVAGHHFPYLPVRWLLLDRYDNVTNLSHYTGPVSFLLAERDEVVPAKFGRALHESYQGGPKLLEVQTSRDHNTLDLQPSQPFWQNSRDLFHSTEF